MMDFESLLRRMESIPGWFSAEEARLLHAGASDALTEEGVAVEIGSYFGRSTVVLAHAAQGTKNKARVFAVDPHEGLCSMPGGVKARLSSSFDGFIKNLRDLSLEGAVIPIRKTSKEVEWNQLIDFLFIDGLHDYESVWTDLSHFYPWLRKGGIVAFHDYGNPDFPDVKKLVDRLILGYVLRPKAKAGSLILCEKLGVPSLSIIIPTISRPSLKPLLDELLKQLGPLDEIIMVGDGPQPGAQVVAETLGAQVRYFEYGPTRCWGAAQRNFGMSVAKGGYLLFIDDDDRVLPNYLRAVRSAALESPWKPLIFRTHHGQTVLWSSPKLVLCNVSTQMFAVPNIKDRLGKWKDLYEGDFHFISETVSKYPEGISSIVWRNEITTIHGIGGRIDS